MYKYLIYLKEVWEFFQPLFILIIAILEKYDMMLLGYYAHTIYNVMHNSTGIV